VSEHDEDVPILNSSFNYEELCAAFICLHFSAHFNKTQLATVLEFQSILTPVKLPKTFDECTDTLFSKYGGNPILDKTWYCTKCKAFDTSMNSKDRECPACGTNLSNYIYLSLENQIIKLIKKFPNVSLPLF
jgi:hypothetical protein